MAQDSMGHGPWNNRPPPSIDGPQSPPTATNSFSWGSNSPLKKIWWSNRPRRDTGHTLLGVRSPHARPQVRRCVRSTRGDSAPHHLAAYITHPSNRRHGPLLPAPRLPPRSGSGSCWGSPFCREPREKLVERDGRGELRPAAPVRRCHLHRLPLPLPGTRLEALPLPPHCPPALPPMAPWFSFLLRVRVRLTLCSVFPLCYRT